MTYFLNLYSPHTYDAFSASSRTRTGFRKRHEKVASHVKPGDRFLCYLIGLSRWVGIEEVVAGPFIDSTPLFEPDNDPFIVRFDIRPVIWLPKEQGIPIHEDVIWNALSFTKGRSKGSSAWAMNVKGSLRQISPKDSAILVKLLREQLSAPRTYPIVAKGKPGSATVTPSHSAVKVPDKDVATVEAPAKEAKESTRIQALLAEIGTKMNFKVWLPKADRAAVLKHCDKAVAKALLEALPLSYDAETTKTIQQIDIIWLKGKSIARAFEVEHTTSVYSGLLRMADLLALQPDISIRLHIVAPESRRKKVLDEIRRPTFQGLDLPEKCTFIAYDRVEKLHSEKHLAHMSDSVVDEYEEYAPATE